METKTETLTLPLMHLYHLTADSANDTGYTMEQVTQMLEEYGPDHQIEATITVPLPPPYSVEWDIEQHQQRIANNQNQITQLQEQLATLEEGSNEYIQIQEQIIAVEEDIVMCESYIASIS
jgi:DNA-binding transcriptional MerR regulator